MREIINIVNEAGRRRKTPIAPPQDLNSIYAQVNAVAVSLSRNPFDIRWDRSLVDTVVRRLRDMRKAHEQDIADEIEQRGVTTMSPFDPKEHVVDFANVNFRKSATFFRVKSEIRHYHDEYQDWHAERNKERGGSPDNYIESSDWLQAMDAQSEAAEAMELMTFAPEDIKKVVASLETFVERFDINVADQGHAPVLAEDMRSNLARIIPLMMFVLRTLNSAAR